MTASMERGSIGAHGVRLSRSLHPARLFVSLGRALWLPDRGVTELRWAAITFGAIAGLAAVAKLIDPVDTAFDLALTLSIPSMFLAIAAGWSPWGARLVARRWTRVALGPFVLAVAMAAGSAIDIHTLAMPETAPLVVLALTYAAITPGYPLAAAMTIVSWLGVGVAHASIAAATPAGTLMSDDYTVRGAVVLLASLGMYLVVRVATDAEHRATRLANRNRARLDALESLERIVRRFDGTRSVRDVIQDVVDDVSRTFEITLVAMYLPDDYGRLAMVGVAGYHSPFHIIEPGVGVIGRAASTLETQFVPDVLADPDYRAARDDVRSEIATPIVHHGELLGIVNFEGTLRQPVTTSHVALAEMMARSIAAALRTARLDDERRQRLHAIERVLDVSRGLVSDLDQSRTMRAVVDAATDLLSADRVLVATRDRTGIFHVTGGEEQERELHPTVDGPALEAIETGARIVRAVAGSDGKPTRWAMAMPIRINGDVAAVLMVSRPASGAPFGALDSSIADLLVTQIGVALHNADRHATVVDTSLRDPLTGLFNRGFFDEAVEKAFAVARRSSMPLSLIVLDLDRFSAVNNDYGHTVGDAVLRRVATAMSMTVRDGDIVARYGGEEFVIVAPGTSAEDAVGVAERVRAAVATASASTTHDGMSVPITVSAGVACLLGDELDGHALFRAADSALLAAKRAGRDRVVSV